MEYFHHKKELSGNLFKGLADLQKAKSFQSLSLYIEQLLRPKRSEGLPFLALAIPGGIGAIRVLQQKVVQDLGIFG